MGSSSFVAAMQLHDLAMQLEEAAAAAHPDASQQMGLCIGLGHLGAPCQNS